MLIKDFGGETVDTRAEASRPGPYCDGLAVLLHGLDTENEFAGDFTIVGTGRRFGRRVLWCDTQGFMWTVTYATEESAQNELLNAFAEFYADEDLS